MGRGGYGERRVGERRAGERRVGERRVWGEEGMARGG